MLCFVRETWDQYSGDLYVQYPTSCILGMYCVKMIVLKWHGLIYWDDLLVFLFFFYEFKFELCLLNLKASFPGAS